VEELPNALVKSGIKLSKEWKITYKARPTGVVDYFYYTPGGERLRGIPEVREFLAAAADGSDA
jgi:hypothetical protein